ncbi:hypothetical protein [Hydrogenobaculum sp.]|nr:MAG: hypothetical protein C0170_08350 [Hydrogenobaculum sp.]PMP89865.1 MAG: hypothetical protein C0170_07740 [Hydrogenobaculum sp.]HEK25047.1 hypothetical protein [Hydrogenobaculum sp.]
MSLFVSKAVFACACGCGVFEVTLPSMMPKNTQNTVFFKYTFMDQVMGQMLYQTTADFKGFL